MEIDLQEEMINNEYIDPLIPHEEKEESDLEDKKSLDDENIEIELLNDGDAATLKKSRKKRRTKDQVAGRDYVCALCQKAYLSYPALTNHRKSKHENLQCLPVVIIDDKKKRGRPKKNIYTNFLADYDTKIKTFYDHESRKNIKENSVDTHASINIVLDQNPTLKQDLTNTNFLHNIININSENLPCKLSSSIDDAFISFISYSHTKISDDYFLFLLKFILYFRKSIINSPEINIDTAIASSDLIPDYSNDFFIFMNENNLFDLTTDEEKLEMVSLIQYICHWLKENDYSKSKLYLLQK